MSNPINKNENEKEKEKEKDQNKTINSSNTSVPSTVKTNLSRSPNDFQINNKLLQVKNEKELELELEKELDEIEGNRKRKRTHKLQTKKDPIRRSKRLQKKNEDYSLLNETKPIQQKANKNEKKKRRTNKNKFINGKQIAIKPKDPNISKNTQINENENSTFQDSYVERTLDLTNTLHAPKLGNLSNISMFINLDQLLSNQQNRQENGNGNEKMNSKQMQSETQNFQKNNNSNQQKNKMDLENQKSLQKESKSKSNNNNDNDKIIGNKQKEKQNSNNNHNHTNINNNDTNQKPNNSTPPKTRTKGWGYLFHQLEPRETIVITSTPYSFGSASRCQYHIQDHKISGLLTRIVDEVKKDKYLEVHGDKGNVFLNGKWIKKGHKIVIKSGDQIVIESSKVHSFIFVLDSFFVKYQSLKKVNISNQQLHTQQQKLNFQKKKEFYSIIDGHVRNPIKEPNTPSLDELEYPIDTDFKKLFTQLFEINLKIFELLGSKQFPKNISNRILLTGRNETQVFQKKLCLSLAKKFKIPILIFDFFEILQQEKNIRNDKLLKKKYQNSPQKKNNSQNLKNSNNNNNKGINSQNLNNNNNNDDINNNNANNNNKKDNNRSSTNNFNNNSIINTNLNKKNNNNNNNKEKEKEENNNNEEENEDSKKNEIFNSNTIRKTRKPQLMGSSEFNEPNSDTVIRYLSSQISLNDRIRFIGPKFIDMKKTMILERLKRYNGPNPGSEGTVKIIFHDNGNTNFVGVDFDEEIKKGGHSFGNLTKGKNGFFVRRNEVSKIDGTIKDYSILLIESLFQFLESIPNKGFLLFIPNIETCIFHSFEIYETFKTKLVSLTKNKPIIIIGGVALSGKKSKNSSNDPIALLSKNFDKLSGVSNLFQKKDFRNQKDNQRNLINNRFANDNKNSNTFNKNAKQSNSSEIEKVIQFLTNLFPTKMPVKRPKKVTQFEKWKMKTDEDKLNLRIKKNIKLFEETAKKYKIMLDNIQPNCFSLIEYSPKDVFEILGCSSTHKITSLYQETECNTTMSSSTELDFEKNIKILDQNDLNYGIQLHKQLYKIGTNKLPEIDIEFSNEYEEKLISEVIPPNRINISFKDIGALHDVKEVLREFVILPLKRRELFQRGNLIKPCKGILLFGPPGTGKTMLAKAIATESGAHFLNISMATISSKWFGEGEKIAKAVFTLASKLSPSIIFIDEVDSLLNRRGKSGEHEASRKIKNTFMEQWDGMKRRDDERVIVLAATNRPHDLDEAVLRRFPRRLYVDMPDFKARKKILQVILKCETIENNFDFDKLARITQGFSGSDLKNLATTAGYYPIRELLSEEFSKLGKTLQILGDYKPQSQSQQKTEIQTRTQNNGIEIKTNDKINDKMLKSIDYTEQLKLLGSEKGKNIKQTQSVSKLRPITLRDFEKAKKNIKISVSMESLVSKELREWNRRYGEGGVKEKRYEFYN
ncbi:aaa-type atpase family protein-related [Anaeramoeba flamelloides]|uniref:Aaa-type atpase family protein-related n=1 Tax=Anaeramoeba flamelloides TaxID=1746091 RepID=A0ABQ8Y2S0_9EUKA|nr:aaa-type atpase family protein-related [Anaeramoeba flamelloides]